MSSIRTTGGDSPWRDPMLSPAGQEALGKFSSDAQPDWSSRFLNSHQDTDDLRFVAERYRRRRRGYSESTVNFELDESSGRIIVKIHDELTGNLKLRMTPEQVEQVLRQLEETDDNDASLSSFFLSQ